MTQGVVRCVPCRGTGIYPLDIEAVESGRLRPENARGCGACYGTIRLGRETVTRVRVAPVAPTALETVEDARLAAALKRSGGKNPFI